MMLCSEPMDPNELDAAEVKHTDEFGITLSRSNEPMPYCGGSSMIFSSR
jgi:hypothetical protein